MLQKHEFQEKRLTIQEVEAHMGTYLKTNRSILTNRPTLNLNLNYEKFICMTEPFNRQNQFGANIILFFIFKHKKCFYFYFALFSHRNGCYSQR